MRALKLFQMRGPCLVPGASMFATRAEINSRLCKESLSDLSVALGRMHSGLSRYAPSADGTSGLPAIRSPIPQLMSFTFINPESLGAPQGYANGVLAEAGGRLLFIAGQIAWNQQQQIVSDDIV